jgi:NAD(P)-dependent dehydrogenase (short-subunit alcohol dehydrogenase family)
MAARTGPTRLGREAGAIIRISSSSADSNAFSDQSWRNSIMSKFDLTGRKALVTGGARGLGAGMAEALAKAGAAVMIGDILGDVGRATAKTLAAGGAKAGFVALDVTDEASWENAVSVTVAELGGFDILINNAGVEITSLLVDVSQADLRRMCDINIVGVALGMKHAFRAMRPGGAAGKGGSVVSTSSVAATIAFPGIAGYSATKSAVDRLTRVGAMEAGKLGYGVRVNCIYPGLVPTDMGMQLAADVVTAGLYPSVEAAVGDVIGQTPLARLGEVADMADVVVFLCSDAARFITGAGVPVDGGMGM